jgi:nucleotide-binding universal stress UspA family protein
VRFGVPEEKIETISWTRALGHAKDILEYARRHMFNAVVVGRRGLSKAQKIFMGSTSAKIVEHADAMPLWIVDGDVQSRKILAAVDASDTSSRIVDYLAIVLGKNPDVRLTFYHVYDDSRALITLDDSGLNADLSERIDRLQKNWIEQFHATARERLNAAGIDNSQVKWVTTVRSERVPKMIMAYARTHDFGTVVLGRRGSNDAFFTGRTAHYAAERMTDRTLWIVG